MSTLWRSFQVPVSGLQALPGFEEALQKQLAFLQGELNTLLQDATFMAQAKALVGESRGDYWNKLTAVSHKPHLKWQLEGERAKYWRMLLERIRVTQESLVQREAIAQEWHARAWDEARLKEVAEAVRARGFRTSTYECLNVLRAGRTPTMPPTLPMALDFTVGDKQVIRPLSTGGWEVKLGSEWWAFTIPTPSYARPGTGRQAKPVFQGDKQGRLVCRVAYELAPVESHGRGAVLGVDLGKLKPFTAAAVFPDGSYSTELVPSREQERLQEKLSRLRDQQRGLQAKQNALEALLAGREDAFLRGRLARLEAEAKAVAGKASLVKAAASRLVGRDVVAHALEQGAGTIRLEDLRFTTGKSGKWDHSRSQQWVREVAEVHGLKVEVVPAAYSSQTDPFSDQRVTPNSKRTITTASGRGLDRDYAAGIELARRSPKRKASKLAVREAACRDKFGPTPKRPKAPSRARGLVVSKSQQVGPVGGFGPSSIVAASSIGQVGVVPATVRPLGSQTSTFTRKALLC